MSTPYTFVPVDAAGNVRLTLGDDYAAADSRELKWNDDENEWPTGSAITLAWTDLDGTKQEIGTGTVVAGSPNVATLTITSAETTALSAETTEYELRAVEATRKLTLRRGLLVLYTQHHT